MHIYRLISESTVEENILLKARQKTALMHMSVEEGNFNSSNALFGAVNLRQLVGSNQLWLPRRTRRMWRPPLGPQRRPPLK